MSSTGAFIVILHRSRKRFEFFLSYKRVNVLQNIAQVEHRPTGRPPNTNEGEREARDDATRRD